MNAGDSVSNVDDGYLAARRRRYAQALQGVEERLQHVADQMPGELRAITVDTLEAGGKRLRPLLTLLAARADRPLGEYVVRAASAVELLHTATLIHDDVLDDAVLRRGRATIASRRGSQMAVSVGNGVLAVAVREVASTGDAAAIAVLTKAALELARGEVLQREQVRCLTLAPQAYERRCELKTAGLFAASCWLGAYLSGLSAEVATAMAEYGRLIGLAFQVLDDVLDCGDGALTGKQSGTDLRDGTVTLPLLYALEERPQLATLLAHVPLSDDDVDAALALIAESSAAERAREAAMRYIEEAQRTLSAYRSAPLEHELLAEVGTRVVARYT